MILTGTRAFDAPAEQVWGVLNDPGELAGLLPGVERFEIQDETHFTAAVKVPLGLGGLRLKLRFERTEERPIEYAALRAKGQGIGAVVSLETKFTLLPDGNGTRMDWEADVHVLGQVGSMGQRVLQPIMNQQVENVLAALDQRVQAAGSAA